MQKWLVAALLAATGRVPAAQAASRHAAASAIPRRKPSRCFSRAREHWFEVQPLQIPVITLPAVARLSRRPLTRPSLRRSESRAPTRPMLHNLRPTSTVPCSTVGARGRGGTNAYRMIAGAGGPACARVWANGHRARMLTARQDRGGDWPSHRQRPPLRRIHSATSTFTRWAWSARFSSTAIPRRKLTSRSMSRSRAMAADRQPALPTTEERLISCSGEVVGGGFAATLRKSHARDLMMRTQEADGGWSLARRPRERRVFDRNQVPSSALHMPAAVSDR